MESNIVKPTRLLSYSRLEFPPIPIKLQSVNSGKFLKGLETIGVEKQSSATNNEESVGKIDINEKKDFKSLFSTTEKYSEAVTLVIEENSKVVIDSREFRVKRDAKTLNLNIFCVELEEQQEQPQQQQQQKEIEEWRMLKDNSGNSFSSIKNRNDNEDSFAMGGRRVNCPYCYIQNFTVDELVQHVPEWHGDENVQLVCPVCVLEKRSDCFLKKGDPTWGYSSHLHHEHGRTLSAVVESGSNRPTFSFSVVVVHRPEDNKFLLIQEGCKVGWWLPAGRVDTGENFFEAAHRETLEEGGIEIELKGILQFEYWPLRKGGAKQRITFYAQPKYKDQKPKEKPGMK